MRLEIRSISKQFGLDHALRRVTLALRAGTLHAILGPGGAGKSSLAALLGGLNRPDAGEFRMDGHRYAPRSLRKARAAGVSVLLHHPPLAPELTVEETLLLGFEPTRLGLLHRAARREAARRALVALRSDDIPLDLPLGRLPVHQRRRVALARGLTGAPRLVVLDEPDALPDYDYASLLTRLRDLAAAGASILLLTRSPDRARTLGGEISLLREGVLEPPMVALPPRFSLEPHRSDGAPAPRRLRPRLGSVLLALHHVMSADHHAPISLTLREGEILGLAGLPCSGRGALLRVIAGHAPLITGAMHLDGRTITRLPAARRQRLGMEMISGKHPLDDALFPDRSVIENLLLTRMGQRRRPPANRPLGRWGFYPRETSLLLTRDWMEKLAIRPGRPEQPVHELSRANRRKLALARVFQSRARLLLLDDPAARLDADTRARITAWIGEMAAEGRAVLLSGPSPQELLGFCDTVAAFCRGRLTDMRPAAGWTLPELERAIHHPPLSPAS